MNEDAVAVEVRSLTDPLVIEVRGLALHGFHGVHDFEREQGQRFVIDVVAVPRRTLACETDRLSDAVSYGDIARTAHAVASEQRFDLIERLAAVIGDTLLARFPLARVSVSVHKPDAPIGLEFGDVVVTVTRSSVRRA